MEKEDVPEVDTLGTWNFFYSSSKNFYKKKLTHEFFIIYYDEKKPCDCTIETIN